MCFHFDAMSELFSSEQSNICVSSKGFESENGGNVGKHTDHLYEKEGWELLGDTGLFSRDFSLFSENTSGDGLLHAKYSQEYHSQMFSDFGNLDDLCFDLVSPPFQSCYEEIMELANVNTENLLLDEPKKELPRAIPLSSLGILKNYSSRFKRLNGEKLEVPEHGTASTKPESKVGGRKLSTVDILRLAGEKFIQSSSLKVDDLSTPSCPFGGSFVDLSDDEAKDVELIHYLLASSEKVGQQQYDRARELLRQCDDLSPDSGIPVQRIAYYFSEALREKIDQKTGKLASKGSVNKHFLDVYKATMSPHPAIIALHQEVPISMVFQFAGMQAIIEHVAEAKKIHLIDLEIRCGTHCPVLMQSLAGRTECPLELLKITAVGTKSKSTTIEDTGKRLMSFAQSMNLPFSFNVVVVVDMLDLNEDLFDLEAEEAVVVNAICSLSAMLVRPDWLESSMRVLRNINPCLMVVTEMEGNHNSPVFVNRFIETLFYYGAYFDCLEACMNQNVVNRKISESMYFGQAIRNIIVAEGEERTTRHVSISVWRSFFARFGMVEEELSKSSLYQASLVLKNFACGSSCTLDIDGKCLLIGWKEAPLHSLSIWKFI